jgi:hypothetical protein
MSASSSSPSRSTIVIKLFFIRTSPRLSLRELDEAIRLNPKLAGAYSNRGDAYRQKGELDRAIADLSEAIRLDPKITPAYANRGLAYEQKGDLDLARVDFMAALERRGAGKYTTTESALATARARLAALGSAVPEPARREASQLPESRPAFIAGRRVALVIGNDKYPNPSVDAQLANAANDARAVRRTLEGLGFEVLYGENLDRRAFVDKLSDLRSRLNKDAIALFYFAGHGVAFSGANYLLPSDIAKPRPTVEVRGEEARLAGQAVAEAQVIERITDSGARVAIAVLDACRDNPLRGSGARSLGGTRGLAQSPQAEGLFSIYSAGFGQQRSIVSDPTTATRTLCLPGLHREAQDAGARPSGRCDRNPARGRRACQEDRAQPITTRLPATCTLLVCRPLLPTSRPHPSPLCRPLRTEVVADLRRARRLPTTMKGAALAH